ncbi:MAG: hypothetical protein GTO40_27050 [Deltaproteobacteria bacterium]|nr:hypothetical protein [Deltaproteobacteria bacterium]
MAGRIEVTKKDDKTFLVAVNARTTTSHTVTLEPDYYTRLTGGKVTPEKLIEKSFEFLLERESNTSILSNFDLPLINHYFPEYELSIGQRLLK